MFEIFPVVGQMIVRDEISMSESAARQRVAICLFCNVSKQRRGGVVTHRSSLRHDSCRTTSHPKKYIRNLFYIQPPCQIYFSNIFFLYFLGTTSHPVSDSCHLVPSHCIVIGVGRMTNNQCHPFWFTANLKRVHLVQSSTASFCKLSIPRKNIFEPRSWLSHSFWSLL